MRGKFAFPLIALFAVLVCGAADYAREADDFLRGKPADAQFLQAQAIRRAIEGDLAGLAAVRHARRPAVQLPDGVTAADLQGKYRLYRAKSAAGKVLPLLVYLHGGGWTFGSIASCAAFCGALAADGRVAVLAVEYRLAPEHPYPAALDDVSAALRFARENAAKLGVDPGRISAGGDSSGGNLALAAGLKHSGELRSLVLFYPVTKAWNDGSESWRRYPHALFGGEVMEAFNDAYCGKHDPRDPFISPACASDAALRGLPPMLLVAADRDILRDQGKEFSDRAAKAGVLCRYVRFPGSVHLFITVPGQPSAFRDAVELTADFLAR